MKTLPAGLLTLLRSGVTTLCTCWRVERLDGEIFGFTDHDKALSFAGVTYEPASGFTASDIASELGLAVDTMEVSGALSSDAIAEADIALGLWDNAAVEIWCLDWSDTDNRVITRKGALGEIVRGDLAFQTEVRGLAYVLNQERGRTYQRPCDAVLGDPRCTVDLTAAAFAGTGSVQTAIDDRLLTVDGLAAFDDGWFSAGVLTWTAGKNAGAEQEVAAHLVTGSAVTLQLWQRAALAVATGDTFSITAGCDKTFETCKSKFDNVLNHRGFPHMPGNDFALGTAKMSDAANDGGSFFNG